MKKIFKGIGIVTLLLLTACGGNKETNEQNLTPLQSQAVAYVKKHLDNGEKLESYQVVEEPLPPSVLEQPFLSLRNNVFKAGLDYQSCKTRNLQAGMEMAEQKLEVAREKILATEDVLNQDMGGENSLIVLAKVKSPRSHDGSLKSLIVAFDPETMEVREWLPVTTPVQNTVALVVCAKDGTLSEYAKEMNHETSLLIPKVSDPVLKFVLEAKAL